MRTGGNAENLRSRVTITNTHTYTRARGIEERMKSDAAERNWNCVRISRDDLLRKTQCTPTARSEGTSLQCRPRHFTITENVFTCLLSSYYSCSPKAQVNFFVLYTLQPACVSISMVTVSILCWCNES